MKVILFGATGMIGQGVLRECLLDPTVEHVLSIGRRPSGTTHDKLREVVLPDLTNYASTEGQLGGFDACFFCLGTSSAGMSEADYRHITYDVTLAAAHAIARESPDLAFVYESGVGTDSSEKGRTMWARVKGATENAVIATFPKACMFRPGYIQPMHGIKASGRGTRVMYAAAAPLYPVWKRLFPRFVTTTEQVGRAMLRVAREGAPQRVMESAEIAAFAQ
jgi:uncharacterized protein YbjT (DUF2867 family)